MKHRITQKTTIFRSLLKNNWHLTFFIAFLSLNLTGCGCLRADDDDDDSYIKYSYSKFELEEAIQEKDIKKIKRIIANTKSKTKLSEVLPTAIKEGSLEIVKLLVEVENGPDLNTTAHTWDKLPLHTAIEANKPDIVKYLIEKGADVNKKINYGDSPLMAAIKLGNVEIVKTILDRIHQQSPSLLKREVNKLANFNDSSYNEQTALHYAVRTYNKGLARLLFTYYGARTDIKDANGFNSKTVDELAQNDSEIYNILYFDEEEDFR